MEIARYWRLNNQRYTLTGTICTCCGKPSLSQRPVCDRCRESAADGHDSQRVTQALVMPVREFAGGK